MSALRRGLQLSELRETELGGEVPMEAVAERRLVTDVGIFGARAQVLDGSPASVENVFEALFVRRV